MDDLAGLPGTLLFTLRARAEENGRAHPLFADPLAADWYARMPQSVAGQQAMADAYSPVFALGTAVRTRLYDDIATRFLNQPHHPDQPCIVELGAGLSTRFHRLGLDRALWVEVDLPAAIAARRLVDGSEGAQHCFLPYVLGDEGWVSALKAITAVPPAHFLFIAEGVLFFLSPAEIAALFALLGQHFPGATIALDVLSEQFSHSTRRRFAAHDAPMQWFIGDEGELAGLGLMVKNTAVVAHQFPVRWQELGFDPGQLQTTRVNVLVEALIRDARPAIRVP
jgi:methyltransferase (TIGR00027 family)